MFIGTVYFGKNIVEHLKLEVATEDEASHALSKYVFEEYNKDVPPNGIYFTGVVINTDTIKVLAPEPVAV